MVENRNHKIKSDYGIRDYYKFYRDNGGTQSYDTYKKIIVEFNHKIADVIINNEYNFKLPSLMGVITVKKRKNYVKLDAEGNLRTNYPPNFKATKELWAKNPIAKEKKTLIRYENKHSNKYSYVIRYLLSFAKYKNKVIYSMQFNRQYLKYKLRDLIFESGELERGLES